MTFLTSSSINTGAQLAGDTLSIAGTKKTAEGQITQLQQEAQLGQTEAAFQIFGVEENAERTRSSQAAAAGASGATISGSALEVMRQSAFDAEFEALSIQYGADEASKARQRESDSVQSSANSNIIGSLLGSAAKFSE